MSDNIKKIRKMNNMYLLAIIGVSVALSLTLGLISLAYGESANDFTLEAKVNTPRLDVTRFTISGESYKEICPSGQCKIDYEDKYTFFGAPTPTQRSISYNIEFRLQDDMPNANVGPKKKEFLEHFGSSMFGCMVDDIIEDNGQELYYCHDGNSIVDRKFDDKIWKYDSIGVYDAKNGTLKVNGNFTGSR